MEKAKKNYGKIMLTAMFALVLLVMSLGMQNVVDVNAADKEYPVEFAISNSSTGAPDTRLTSVVFDPDGPSPIRPDDLDNGVAIFNNFGSESYDGKLQFVLGGDTITVDEVSLYLYEKNELRPPQVYNLVYFPAPPSFSSVTLEPASPQYNGGSQAIISASDTSNLVYAYKGTADSGYTNGLPKATYAGEGGGTYTIKITSISSTHLPKYYVERTGIGAGTIKQKKFSVDYSGTPGTIAFDKKDLKLSVTTNPVDVSIDIFDYESSNPSVATIGTDGTIMPVALGDTNLKVKLKSSAEKSSPENNYQITNSTNQHQVTVDYGAITFTENNKPIETTRDYNVNNTFTYNASIAGGDGTETFTYAFVDTTIPAATAEINALTGEVTYYKFIDDLEVEATMTNPVVTPRRSGTYKVTIKGAAAPEQKQYTYTGDTWVQYPDTAPVYFSIKKPSVPSDPYFEIAANSPYQIAAYPNGDDIRSAVFTNSVKFGDGNITPPNGFVYLLKDGNGVVTEAITTTDYFTIDAEKPEIKNTDDIKSTFIFEELKNDDLGKLINRLSFGLFCKEKIQVTVTAYDPAQTSTPDSIELTMTPKDGSPIVVSKKVTENDITISEDSGNYTSTGKATFTIPLPFEGTIEAEAIDKAGNKSSAVVANKDNSNMEDDHGLIVLEADAPVVDNTSVTQTNGVNKDTSPKTIDGKQFVSGDAKVSFDAVDAGSGLSSVDVFVNDSKVSDENITYNDGKVYPNGKYKNERYQSKDTYVLDLTGISPDGNGMYTVKVIAKDNSGNISEKTTEFYQDTTAATIKSFNFTSNSVLKDQPAVEETDYGYFFKEPVKVTITAEDQRSENETTAGLDQIFYQVIDVNGKTDCLDNGDINVGSKTVDASGSITLVVKAGFKGQIYAYATDKLGNSTFEYANKTTDKYPQLPSTYNDSLIIKDGDYKGYVHPRGVVSEDVDTHKEKAAISIKETEPSVYTEGHQYPHFPYEYNAIPVKNPSYEAEEVPLYNAAAAFNISVEDGYSGISTIKWDVLQGVTNENPGESIQSGDIQVVENKANLSLEGSDKANWTIAPENVELNTVQKLVRTEPLVIDISKANHNDLILRVEFTDNAGHHSYDYYVFGIDTTPPAIDVTMTGEVQLKHDDHGFFNAPRKATIVVIERNFDKSKIIADVKKDGADWDYVNEQLQNEANWTHKDDEKTPNGDGTTHSITVEFNDDADYTFSISGGDRAGLKCEADKVNYTGDTPNNFTIDQTVPDIKDLAIDKIKQINGVKADEAPTEIDGKYYITGDAEIPFNVQADVSGLNEVIIEVNGTSVGSSNISIKTPKGETPYPNALYKTTQYKDKDEYVLNTKGILTDAKFNGEEAGKYVIKVTAKNNAGNKSTQEITVYKDITAAVVEGFAFSPLSNDDGNDGSLAKITQKDYGYYFQEAAVVTVTAIDKKQSEASNEAVIGVKSITYAMVVKGSTEPLNPTTKDVDENNQITFDVPAGFKGQIYAYATDKLGQSAVDFKTKDSDDPYPVLCEGYDDAADVVFGKDELTGYVHPLGLICETQDNHMATSNITIKPDPDKKTGTEDHATRYEHPDLKEEEHRNKTHNYDDDQMVPLYQGAFNFDLEIEDPISGIREVKWTVIEGGKNQSSETLTVDKNGKLSDESWKIEGDDQNLVTKITKQITVDGNYNDMVLCVELKDRAGNRSYDYYIFGIDKTDPTISVSYDNNDGKTIENMATNPEHGYFKDNRIATITVTERNFDPDRVVIESTSTGEKPVFEGWTSKPATENGDKTTHIATLTYTAEADYTFGINMTDRANRECKDETVDYGANLTPKSFTIDKKNPEISDYGVDKVVQLNGVNKGSKPILMDGKQFISGDATVEFSVQDAVNELNGKNRSSGLRSVDVLVNGNKVSDENITYNDGKAYPNGKYKTERYQSKDTYVLDLTGISPDADGKYVVEVIAKDNALNENPAEKQEVVTLYKDITAATIEEFNFTAAGYDEGTNKPAAVEVTDYGYYFRENVNVTITAKDRDTEPNEAESGVKWITYCAVDINGTKIAANDVNVSADNKVSFIIPTNFKGQIYAYATDKLGQSAYKVTKKEPDAVSKLPTDYNNPQIVFATGDFAGYVHPTGSIVENSEKHLDTSNIKITAPSPAGTEDHPQSYSYSTLKNRENSYDPSQMVPLYKGGFDFSLSVEDTYSGIREIKWTVIEGGQDQSTATVSVDNAGNLTGDSGWGKVSSDHNLVTKMTRTVAVDGNYNDMVFRVDLEDRAGNKSYDYYIFGIDKTAPTIRVEYNNNDGDSIGTLAANHAYFKADRIATITVTERNFDPARVTVNATSNGGGMPVSLSWAHSTAGGNADASTHVAQINYNYDADFTFTMNMTDRVGWGNNGIDYAGSLAPENFTVDKTAPVVTVSYDNNNVANEKYFNANRTATITVNEHNFTSDRIITQITGALDGAGIGVPGVGWSGGGDTNYGTAPFTTDGDYTLNVTEIRDRAGNTSTAAYTGAAPQDFTIDTQITKPIIVGVTNETAYKDDFGDGGIGFDILDINFGSDTIQLLRSSYDKRDEDVTSEFITNVSRTAKGDVGRNNLVDKIRENDGLYTLNVSITDKATNTASESVTFSVNRYGSVYVYGPYLNKVLTSTVEKNENTGEAMQPGYTNEITGPLSIEEYNVNRLESNSVKMQVTRDAAPLSKVTSSVTPAPGSSTERDSLKNWYHYTHSADKSNFAQDGIYTMALTSKDEAGNTPVNSADNTKPAGAKDIVFRVDSVNPELTSVTGLDKETVNAVEANVNFSAFDAIALQKVLVFVGKDVKDLSDKEIDEKADLIAVSNPTEEQQKKGYIAIEDLTNYTDNFTVGEGVNQEVRFVFTDKAGNLYDTHEVSSNDLSFFKFITVSTNPFVRWFASSARAIGTIIGGILLAIALFFILFKRRKKR